MKKSKFTEEQIAFAKRLAGLTGGVTPNSWQRRSRAQSEHNRFSAT